MKPIRLHPLWLAAGAAALALASYYAGVNGVEGASRRLTGAVIKAAQPLGAPVAQVSNGVAQGIGDAALKPMLDGMEANTNRQLLNLQVLGPRGLVAVKDPRCNAYVDLVTAASRQAPEDRDRMVAEAIAHSQQMNCIRPKAPVEQLDASLRLYYEAGRGKLLATPQCAPYQARADEIVFGPETTVRKRALLAEAFVVALERGCSRP